jgi:hypothetical protein
MGAPDSPDRPRSLRLRVGLSAAVLAAAGLCWAADDAGGARGDQSPTPTPPGLGPGSGPAGGARLGASADEARRAALDRALDWLVAAQARSLDGSWSTADARFQAPDAVVALGALALLAGGSTPERGPRRQAVARAVDYLLGRVHTAADSPVRGFIGALDHSDSRMHGHGFATLALAEAYVSSPTTRRGGRIAELLPLAVERTEVSQGAEGGWEYEPVRVASHEGSVTITLVQGLRAARNAGLAVDPAVIARAEDYVLRSQAEDGSFRYTLGSPITTVALTAAAISTLNAAGRYDDRAVRAGVDAIWRGLDRRAAGEPGSESLYPFYERFYTVQAFWQLSDQSHFERWYPRELERVLEAQEPDGSWPSPNYGRAYGTAFNALFLAVPDALLPIFQR